MPGALAIVLRLLSRPALGAVAAAISASVAILCAPGAGWSQDIPSNLNVTGIISVPNSSRAVVQVNDTVLAVKTSDGSTVGTGTVLAADGTYSISLSEPTSFNGTTLTLRLVSGGQTFHLTSDGTADISFVYAGGLFPVRLALSPIVGPVVSSPPAATTTTTTSTSTSTTPTTSTPTSTNSSSTPTSAASSGATLPSNLAPFDVNGDGVFDQRDLDVIKGVLTGNLKFSDFPKAAVTGGQFVTTRDLIAAIEAMASSRRRSFSGAPASTAATPTTTTSGSTTGSSGTTSTPTTTTPTSTSR